MTINVHTVVWNEEWMLPKFLDHYSQFANTICVIDHASTDRTAEIAKAHPMVKYSKLPDSMYDEEMVNQAFYKSIKKHPSDWAVVVDCDEFVDISYLDKLEKGKVYKTRSFMMVGKTGRLEDCKDIRWPKFDKPIVFDPALPIKFGDGRHTCNLPVDDNGPNLFHYKYPSREYYYERNIKAYPRIMDQKTANYRIKRGLDWYDKHK